GYGYAIYVGRNLIHCGCRPLLKAEVFDVEAEGAWAGLCAAIRLATPDTHAITVCLDNYAVIYCLDGAPSISS
ncbi:hypothetical protein LY78DRAFT_594489, partial [Colletotrichum sublineola]